MAAIIEKMGSRSLTVSLDNPAIELLYAVRRTIDEAEVILTVENEIPYLYNMVSSLGVQALVFQNHQCDHVGGGLWDVSVKYGKKEQKKAGESSFQFDTTSGTAKITQSLETVGAYAYNPDPFGPAQSIPPDFQGAIAVNNDTVEGCEVPKPAYAFAETHYIPTALVTGAYKTKLHRLTGRVNFATFTRADGQVFARGECQFLGASGSKRGTEDWEITFKFTASPNATGLAVGRIIGANGTLVDKITGINKKGFEFLWVRYEDAADAGYLVKQPEFVYVERVNEWGNFGDIGIGE